MSFQVGATYRAGRLFYSHSRITSTERSNRTHTGIMSTLSKAPATARPSGAVLTCSWRTSVTWTRPPPQIWVTPTYHLSVMPTTALRPGVLSPSRITSDVMNTKCSIRGGFRGEAKAPPPPPPFVWVWDFLGQCPRMVHEPLRNHGFQMTKRSQEHFICITSTCISRDLRDPDFNIFPGKHAPGPP